MNKAQTIAAQIGNRAFVMMGAKNLMSDGENAIQFNIGKNCKGVAKIRVALDEETDTYNVSFYGKLSRKTLMMPLKRAARGIQVSELRQTIELETGLLLSL